MEARSISPASHLDIVIYRSHGSCGALAGLSVLIVRIPVLHEASWKKLFYLLTNWNGISSKFLDEVQGVLQSFGRIDRIDTWNSLIETLRISGFTVDPLDAYVGLDFEDPDNTRNLSLIRKSEDVAKNSGRLFDVS